MGLVKVRLFRPFSARRFLGCLPSTTRALAVLDRTKEAGSQAEPLHGEVVTALIDAGAKHSIHTAAGVGDTAEVEQMLAARDEALAAEGGPVPKVHEGDGDAE